MFIITAKLTKKKIIAAVVVVGILLCGMVLLLATGSPDASAETSAPVTKGIKTNTDRTAYLSQLGWKTGAQEVQAQEVRIPDTFDEVMTSYNNLQLQHGFDLLKYRGARVMRYTYEITNYGNATGSVYAELLVYKNQIIGGDIHNNEQGGFIQGLTGPGASAGLSDINQEIQTCACCDASCQCECCKNKTSSPLDSTDAGTQGGLGADTDAGTDASDATVLNDSAAPSDVSVNFYDPGVVDEALVYEDEPAANPDGLPQTPQPDVIEPR